MRAGAMLYLVVGAFCIVAGFIMGAEEPPENDVERFMGRVGMLVIPLIGLCGIIGSVGILRGDRRLAPFTYVIASFGFFAFPIGTIVSVLVITGLSDYLDSTDKVQLKSRRRRARTASAWPGR